MTIPQPTPYEVPFVCNVCGQSAIFQEAHYVNPELPSCSGCGSNVRIRWLVHRLSLELFGRSVPLAEFPAEKSVHGLGLTDPPQIAPTLAERFTYCNTFFTNEPRFDIRCDASPVGNLDFLIASEVFEHVEPPVASAFRNASRLLKRSGFLLLTVPWVWDGDPGSALPELFDWKLDREEERYVIVNRPPDGQEERFYDMVYDGGPGPSLGHTREHFPKLYDWHLTEADGKQQLVNTRRDGTVETFSNLVFHGGPGLVLEMRLFTKNGIEENLRAAGFEQVEFEFQDSPERGIIFGQPWTRPVVARKMAPR